jgi:hypothetical protein
VKYTNNAIFTAIRAAVLAEVSTANCTQTYSPTPAKFPTVFAREIGRFTPAQTATVSNAQDIYETTWEVQVFSNLQSGAKEQAYRLMDAVKSALRRLYFVETMENPIDQTDAKYYTLVARFRRVIGSGEEMPT